MARPLHKLSDAKVKAERRAGRLSDGGGLYLSVKDGGSRSWIFMWKRDGVRSSVGLGPYPAVGLSTARNKAEDCRRLIAQGGDPRAEMRKRAVPVFSDCVSMFLDVMEGEWSNTKHRAQWRSTLGAAYCRKLQNIRVSEIELQDVLEVLQPIWLEKPETASRIRGRIERVLSFAQTKGWRKQANPAIWRGNLQNVLPTPQKLRNGHMPAMPYGMVPDFYSRLQRHNAVAANALQFLILTAARSGEVLNARWCEIDLQGGLWTVPASRMKARKEHRVPLSETALNVLKPLHDAQMNEFVFPGQKRNAPLSQMSMLMLLRRMKINDATPHGFRSSFRDFVEDETNFPRELAEMCLAHAVGSAVERSYRRSDALEKRRHLLKTWADYCTGRSSGDVALISVDYPK